MRRRLVASALLLCLASSPAHAGIGEFDLSGNELLGLMLGGAVGAVALGVLLTETVLLVKDFHDEGHGDPGHFLPIMGLASGSLLVASGFLADRVRASDKGGIAGASAWLVASAGLIAFSAVAMHGWFQAQNAPAVAPVVIPGRSGHSAAGLAMAWSF